MGRLRETVKLLLQLGQTVMGTQPDVAYDSSRELTEQHDGQDRGRELILVDPFEHPR